MQTWATLALLAGCGTSPDAGRPGDQAPQTARDVSPSPRSGSTPTSTAGPDQPTDIRPTSGCPRYQLATNTAHVDDAALVELSGAVASRSTPGSFWVHQDSGAGPQVHLLDAAGKTTRTVSLKDVHAVDWEDIAMLDPSRDPGSKDGPSRLIAADIGDNLSKRDDIALYVFDEPSRDAPPALEVAAHRVGLRYPDRPHNAEALLIDVHADQLVIITKVETANAQLFTAPLKELIEEEITLHAAGQLTLPATPIPGGLRITAADQRGDGAAVLVRTYVNAYEWSVAPGQSAVEAFAGRRCPASLALETQGEAIAYTLDGSGYITLSEGTNPSIWHFQRERDAGGTESLGASDAP